MWRTPVSVLLSALLGSAAATLVYALWLSISQSEGTPSSTEDLRVALALFTGTLWFTIPGAFLLAAAEFALSERFRSDRALDAAIIVVGALAGAAILGVLGPKESFDFALLGGFYGFTTAIIFVLFRRQIRPRHNQHL
jgi:hypothetical protein